MREETSHPIDSGQVIWGFSVLLAGLLFWLYQLGHVGLQQIASFWPLALIGIGLSQLADRGRRHGRRKGWGLMLAGSLLLAGNLMAPEGHYLQIWLGFLPLRISWPLLLVVAGGAIAWHELAAGGALAEEER